MNDEQFERFMGLLAHIQNDLNRIANTNEKIERRLSNLREDFFDY